MLPSPSSARLEASWPLDLATQILLNRNGHPSLCLVPFKDLCSSLNSQHAPTG